MIIHRYFDQKYSDISNSTSKSGDITVKVKVKVLYIHIYKHNTGLELVMHSCVSRWLVKVRLISISSYAARYPNL